MESVQPCGMQIFWSEGRCEYETFAVPHLWGDITNQERIFEDRIVYRPGREVHKIVYWHCLNCGRDYRSTVHEDGSMHSPLMDGSFPLYV